MIFLFVAALLAIVVALISLQFFSRLRMLRSAEAGAPVQIQANRYRPMLRLLSEADLEFVSAHASLRKVFRAERRRLFRGYLRCLTRDYAQLLGGIRLAMVRSGVDRPELARALARNRVLFAIALCRIEVRLALHAAGIGTVDVSGLVDAFDALRAQVGAFSALPAAA